ncbi:hypothetical protein TWF481_002758 [Arthrobotrys musiformis]|uniref:Uncharacterized protein n=1 Tax=Arthrobotrys musiformis TaxID=47236 RepID=A0AAV9VTL1_9PEZI
MSSKPSNVRPSEGGRSDEAMSINLNIKPTTITVAEVEKRKPQENLKENEEIYSVSEPEFKETYIYNWFPEYDFAAE